MFILGSITTGMKIGFLACFAIMAFTKGMIKGVSQND